MFRQSGDKYSGRVYRLARWRDCAIVSDAQQNGAADGPDHTNGAHCRWRLDCESRLIVLDVVRYCCCLGSGSDCQKCYIRRCRHQCRRRSSLVRCLQQIERSLPRSNQRYVFVFCSWSDWCGSAGVWCENGRVVYANIENVGVYGIVSPAWGQLTALRQLSLDSNAFYGMPGPVRCTMFLSFRSSSAGVC